MREELIACLKDEVAPELKRLRDPEAAILKVARERNFAPAQVEALGQISIPAKTLNYLQKNAARGENFPLVDVERLVAKYLELPLEKAARNKAGISQWDQLIDDPASGLPACFASVTDSPLRFVLDTETEEKPVSVKFASVLATEASHRRAEVEMVDVIRSECIDNAREAMHKLATVLKLNPDYSFTHLERDVWYVNGEDYKPTLDKLARYLSAERIPVVRADNAGPDRLFFDRFGVMDKVAHVHEQLGMADAALDFIKNATEVATKAKTETAIAAPSQGESTGGKPSKGAPAVKKKEPASNGGNFFGSLMGAGQKAYTPVEELLSGLPRTTQKIKGISGMMGDGMAPQKAVDQADLDVHHLSVLQDLMTTDPVLAEADPDQVVSIYNTIRENAPQLARDKNVMRVTLRSAIQHEGISPFDLKTFLDTEQSRQKVDFNNQLAGQVRYKGKELSAPNKPQ